MFGERRGDDLRHRDRAEPRFALGRTELRYTISSTNKLAVDAHLPAEEVDPVDGEPEALTLPQSHTGGEHNESSLPRRDRIGEGLDVVKAERHHHRVSALRKCDADTR